MSKPSNMYSETKTWNPFVGCNYACEYCIPSFQKFQKRVGGNPDVRQGTISHVGKIGKKGGCTYCSSYVPHYHPERLKGPIPSFPIVFVCGTGDITFCDPAYTRRILDAIKKHRPRKPKTYYLQSKNPAYFRQFLSELTGDMVLVTTLETNRDNISSAVSKAPPPSKRFRDFHDIKYPRKVVTIEPVMDFDHDGFIDWFRILHSQGSLEYVWFGFDSKNCNLPEPTIAEAQRFVNDLMELGITVKGKTLRGVII